MSFRKLEVDQYNEDEEQFVDNSVGTSQINAGQVGQKQQEVKGLLSRGNVKDAILKALQPPLPDSSTPSQVKDQQTDIVVEALSAAKTTDIQNIIKDMTNSEDVDNLMKYIYKGLEKPERQGYNMAALLAWHGAVVEVSGLGPIVRTLTDRRGA